MSSRRVPQTAVAAFAALILLTSCAGLSPRPATTPITLPTTASTAAAGATVPLRTAVTIPLTIQKKVVPVGFAVLGAYAADPDYWDTVQNGKSFAGLTPVWVVVQYRWPSLLQTRHLALTATTSDGSTARTLVTDLIGGSPQCGIRLEDSRDIVPEGMTCVLVAMKHPKALTAVEFTGSTSDDVVSADPAAARFAKAPLRFAIPGGAKPVPAGAEDPGD